MDPRRAKQVADSFTSAVEQRKYYASAETAPGSGIVGITYGSKEKLPETTPAAASAVPSGGGEDAITKDLASGLTDSNGSLDPQLLRKAAGQICAQHGFKNHDLVTQIRASSEKVIEELHPREPEQ
jgi:hypothetical protein